MKYLKFIWNYFFPRREEFPPILDRTRSYEDEKSEVKFFEPETIEDKFKESKTLKDFINKIDK